jgi:hypothetical protein
MYVYVWNALKSVGKSGAKNDISEIDKWWNFF